MLSRLSLCGKFVGALPLDGRDLAIEQMLCEAAGPLAGIPHNRGVGHGWTRTQGKIGFHAVLNLEPMPHSIIHRNACLACLNNKRDTPFSQARGSDSSRRLDGAKASEPFKNLQDERPQWAAGDA